MNSLKLGAVRDWRPSIFEGGTWEKGQGTRAEKRGNKEKGRVEE